MNAYIKHPLSMEQYLMEGSFHKVFLSKGNVPSERYNYFIDILLGATRYIYVITYFALEMK